MTTDSERVEAALREEISRQTDGDWPIEDTDVVDCEIDFAALARAAIASLSSIPAQQEDRERLFQALRHGDEDHQAWLREAIEAFAAGHPTPAPRGQGNKEKRIAELEAQLAAAQQEEGETMLVVRSSPLQVAMPDDWRSCAHEWALYGDGGDLGGNRFEVQCRKCKCPGDFEEDHLEVVWPTT
jgi:hypothetical protein